MNESQKLLKNMVVMVISTDEELDEITIDEKIDEVKGLLMFKTLSDDEVDEVRASIKSEFSIRLDRGVLIEEKGHERWFLARKSQLEMRYWERYKKYLLADKGFSSKVVNTMDDVLDTLTDLLGDPTRDIVYKRRGLIIGDVQSGKTANYTGLICKAVDSGYKVVVLLTGTIEKLRQQTQKRIDEGFVGVDSEAMMKQKDDKRIIGVGKYDPIHPMALTSTSDDFKQQNAKNLIFDLRNIDGPVVFVVKKNVSVLKRLNKWLKQSGDQVIDHSILLIDDEADNASVNTKSEEDPTAINGQIREMLKAFRRSSYVGFTATPFANIFIDPDTNHAMVDEDLFPKDYIYSLNAPSNYIGARNIFNEDGEAKHMLLAIDDDYNNAESIAFILPLSHKSSIRVRKLPKDLKDAVASFMLANVIEDIRGTGSLHRSMLVNVSRFTAVQEQVSELVNEYLKNMQGACRVYSKLAPEVALKNEYIAQLKKVYETIYENCELSWDEIQDGLYSSCAGIIVQTINQRNGKNFSFDDYKDGLRMIAVGGMSLSRGLTLEGLVVSYFYRNSKMYDTLMQMGRWFGYRNGYADLCRIWMSEESIEWYRHISMATDELREEVKRYEDSGLTPQDFGLRVRSDITALLVTARNKMKTTEKRECVISLSGETIETPEIYSDKERNQHNMNAIYKLIADLNSAGYKKIDGGRGSNVKWGFGNIPVSMILDFLEKMEVSPKNEQFNIPTICKFIRGYRGNELQKWDIAFATGTSAVPYDLGAGIEYSHPVRKYSIENDGKILKMMGSKRRLGTSSDGMFGLGDSQIDEVRSRMNKKTPSQKEYFRNIDRRPLLTIYLIELGDYIGADTPENKKIVEDIKDTIYVGLGIGIPSLADKETKYATYVLNKIAIQQIFEGEIDAWDTEEEECED